MFARLTKLAELLSMLLIGLVLGSVVGWVQRVLLQSRRAALVPERFTQAAAAPGEGSSSSPAAAAAPATAEVLSVDKILTSADLEVARRRSGLYVDKSKAPDFKNMLLLTSARSTHADMFNNWECSSKSLRLDWAVLSMDLQMHKQLDVSRSILVEGRHTTSAAMESGGLAMECNRFRTVISLLKQTGLDLVFVDYDYVFKSDPFGLQTTLGSMLLSGSYEFIYSRDVNSNGPSSADYHQEPDRGNTDLYYVAGSRKQTGLQHLFNSGFNRCKRKRNLDAGMTFWESLVQIRKGRIKEAGAFECFSLCGDKACEGRDGSKVLNYCDVSPWEFVEGSVSNAAAERRMVAYHANWAKSKDEQIDKLKRVGLWSPNC